MFIINGEIVSHEEGLKAFMKDFPKGPPIKIPENTYPYVSNIDDGKLIQYCVNFFWGDEFEDFCRANNIGDFDGARRDIEKKHLKIVAKDKRVFENFPENSPLY